MYTDLEQADHHYEPNTTNIILMKKLRPAHYISHHISVINETRLQLNLLYTKQQQKVAFKYFIMSSWVVTTESSYKCIGIKITRGEGRNPKL